MVLSGHIAVNRRKRARLVASVSWNVAWNGPKRTIEGMQRMKNVKFGLALVAAVIILPCVAVSAPLVYTPINPSFGGNPNNSSHLLSTASAQRTATARDADIDGDGIADPGEIPGSSDADLFVRQLQGRLLSALASQVTEAIFGENPQDSGTITFGDTIVRFERTLTAIILEIEDANGTTIIEVPQLVSS